MSTIFGCGKGTPSAVPYAIGLYITSAYWFTASTSFANPAVTVARSLSNTFAGIAPEGVVAFIGTQLAGMLAATARELVLAPQTDQMTKTGPVVRSADPVAISDAPYSNLEATRSFFAEASRCGISSDRVMCTGGITAWGADTTAKLWAKVCRQTVPSKRRQQGAIFMPIITLGKTGCGVAAAFTLALIQFSAPPALAAEYDIGSIHISQPWARATPKGASSGAAYLTITNNGTTPDRLSFCVASDTSRQCQIHSMSMENDVMKMRPVKDGLEIKPGETITFKPGGFHMMFVDLKHPLEIGLIATATLQFEKAGTLKVEFPVVALGAAAPGAPAGGMMEGHSGMMQMDKH